MPKRVTIFFFTVFSIYSAFAQNSPFIFDHLTIDDGLSQSTVFAITKDANGYMWFGTRDGLSRYDSRSVKVYRNKPNDPKSLSGNSIQCFFIDKDKNLWVGTNEGISIYNADLDNFTQSKLGNTDPERPASNHVTAIAQDRNGTIWIATLDGLNKVVAQNPLKFESFNYRENDPSSFLDKEVRALYLDKGGDFWVGTSKGVSKMITNGKQVTFENYSFTSRLIKGKSWINCLSEDDHGNILVGTEENGIKLLNKASKKITTLDLDLLAGRAIESVRVIQRNGDQEYWIGTIEGLFIYNIVTNRVVTIRNNPEDNTSLGDNSVRSIFIDPSGIYWIGTFYGGVSNYSPLSRQFAEVTLTNSKNQKGYKVAGSITTDSNNNLWVSTDGNGLYCLNSRGETIKHYRHDSKDPASLSHNKIKSILLDDDGLWIGTLNGLSFLNFKTEKFQHYFSNPSDPTSLSDNRVYDIKKSSDGFIWIATYRGGLCRFDKETKSFERFTYQSGEPASISSDAVTFVHEDHEKNLWVGTASGLNRKVKGKNVFEHISNGVEVSPIGGDYVLCIYEDRNNNIWIGTRDTGLKLKRANSSSLEEFTVEQGLPGNNVSGIIEDAKGHLWLSTDNGLSQLDPVAMTFKNYNKTDGLSCKEFNFNSFHKDKNGFLYFGGYNGIVKFHPDSIHQNELAPAITFTKLRVFNKDVQIDPAGKGLLNKSMARTNSLAFNYLQNVFSIEFAVLSYVNPAKNKYAYRLDGFEKNWNYVNDPVATYMNLRPGEYTLLVKGSNNDGIWSKEPIQMAITILPPPWKTWWAYTIYGFIILGLILTLIRFNKMRWKLAHDLQLEHIEKEQQEKLHQAKLNFFTNIAHEIRTPLTLIVSPVEVVEEHYVRDPFIQRHLRTIKSNTTRLMRLINQLLDFQKQETGTFRLKLQEDNIVELLKETVFSFAEYAKTRHIDLRFHSDYQSIHLPFDRDELEKVFCNLLHNAFKFTPGGGDVSISVTVDKTNSTEPFVQVKVEDTGIGIPSEDLPKIFNRFFQAENTNVSESGFGIGLALAKGIITLHGGNISVESQEADNDEHGFTRFTIQLPIATFNQDETIKTFEEITHVTEENHTELPSNDEYAQDELC